MLITKAYKKQIKKIFYPDVGYSEKNIYSRTKNCLLLTLGLFVLLSWLMVTLEDRSWGQSIWFVITTVTTVGYGDWSPVTTEGKFVTAWMGMIIGIPLFLALIESLLVVKNHRTHLKRTGKWRYYFMKNHIILANNLSGNDDVDYYSNVIKQIRESSKFKEKQILIVTDAFIDNMIPEELQSYGVAHVSGKLHDEKIQNIAKVDLAEHIVCFVGDSELESGSSDGYNFSLIHRLREKNKTARIIVESKSDSDRTRLLNAGADTCIRPIRAYPEMLCRAIVAPNSEKVLENLFSSYGDELTIFEHVNKNQNWLDMSNKIMRNKIGTLIAYGNNGNVATNPDFDEIPETTHLFILVKDNRTIDDKIDSILNN